jgi:hypothetical protein
LPIGALNFAALHFIDSCSAGAAERRWFRGTAGLLFLEIYLDIGLLKSLKFAILRVATAVTKNPLSGRQRCIGRVSGTLGHQLRVS